MLCFLQKASAQRIQEKPDMCLVTLVLFLPLLTNPNFAEALAKVHTPFTFYRLEVGRKALF